VANGEYRILALLVLAKLCADAGEQHRKAEGFGHIVVGARVETEDRIGVRYLSRQHDDRPFEAVLAHDLAGVAAVHVGKADIKDDEVDMLAPGLRHGLGCGARHEGGEVVVERQLLGQGLAEVRVVVNDQDLACGTHEMLRWIGPLSG
jgi:hypothetical protein